MKNKIVIASMVSIWLHIAAAAQERFSIEEVLPERTLALFICPDVEAARSAFLGSKGGELWETREIRDFHRHLLSALEDVAPYRQFREEIGFSWESLSKLPGGEAALAVVDFRMEKMPPALLGSFAAKDRSEFLKLWRAMGLEETGDIAECNGICYAWVEGTLLFSTHKGLLEEAVSARTHRDGVKLLSGSPYFKKAVQAARRGTPVFFAFVNMRSALDRLAGETSAEFRQEIEDSGFLAINSVAYGLDIVNREWRQITRIDAPSPRKGILRLLENPPADVALAADVPAGISHFETGKLRWSGDSVEQFISLYLPDLLPSWQKAEAGNRREFGVTLRELWDSLGEEYCSFSVHGDSLLPRTITIRQLRDERAFTDNIAGLARYAKMGLENFPYRGRHIFVFRGVFPRDNRDLWRRTAGTAEENFHSFFIENGRVYHSYLPQSLMDYLDRREEGTLGEKADFRRAAALYPKNAVWVSYGDWRGLLSRLWCLFLPLSRDLEGLARQAGIPFQSNWLPRLRDLTHLSPGYGFIVVDEEGITLESSQFLDIVPPSLAIMSAVAPLYLAIDRVAVHRVREKIEELRKAGEPMTAAEVFGEMPPAEDNAAVGYKEAFDKRVMTQGEEYVYIPYHPYEIDPQEWPKYDAVLAKNEKALAVFVQGATKKYCRFDMEIDKGFMMEVPQIEGMRTCMQYLGLRALSLHRRGKTEEAILTCETGMKIMARFREPYALSFYIRASMVASLIETLQILVNEGETSISQCEKLLELLGEFDPAGDARLSLMGERWMCMNTIDKMLKNEVPDMEISADPAILRAWLLTEKSYVMDSFSSLLSLTDRPYCEIRTELDEVENIPVFLFLNRMLFSGQSILFRKRDSMTAWLDTARIALALEIVNARSGNYPQDLRDVAAILGKLPLDPFTGKNYCYRSDSGGFVVYSAGENMQDDGGEFERSRDIGWRCEK